MFVTQDRMQCKPQSVKLYVLGMRLPWYKTIAGAIDYVVLHNPEGSVVYNWKCANSTLVQTLIKLSDSDLIDEKYQLKYTPGKSTK